MRTADWPVGPVRAAISHAFRTTANCPALSDLLPLRIAQVVQARDQVFARRAICPRRSSTGRRVHARHRPLALTVKPFVDEPCVGEIEIGEMPRAEDERETRREGVSAR